MSLIDKKSKNKHTLAFATSKLALAGAVAALYVVLTMVTFSVASGAIQFRASEALCILPLVFPETIPALFIGCIISNLITGCAAFDVILGSIITLVAAALTYLSGRLFRTSFLKIFVGGLFPVFLNALFLPLIWLLCYGAIEYVYYLQVIFLVISQSLSVYAIGAPLYFAAIKIKQKNRKYFA